MSIYIMKKRRRAQGYVKALQRDMKNIITIGRQFGSGGREIGKRVADALGYAYYDKEIISMISEKSGLSEEYIAEYDEGKITRSFPITMGRTFMMPVPNFSDKIFIEQTKILKEVAKKGNCVIVGRCADYVLEEFDPFKVFVMASDMQMRISRCYEKEPKDMEKPQKEMEKKILDVDKIRAKYYNFYTDKKWQFSSNYNLCIDTSRVPLKETVDIIRAAYEARSKNV